MSATTPAALAPGQGSVPRRAASVTVGQTMLRKLSEMSGHRDTISTGRTQGMYLVTRTTAKISQMNTARLTNVPQVSSRYIY